MQRYRRSMRRRRRSMWRRRRSMWRRLRLGQRRRRSRGGHLMRRYRRSMRRRRRSMRRRRRSARRRRRSRGVIGDCGVGITPQMCNRVTNLGDMSTFSKPGRGLTLTFPLTSAGSGPTSTALKFYVFSAEIAIPLRLMLIPVFHLGPQ